MKILIAFMILCLTSLQASAMVACHYQNEPCNQNGNHYVCYAFGWIGERDPYCSPEDRSSNRPVKASQMNFQMSDWQRECIADCMTRTGQSRNYCSGHYCW